MTAIGTELLRMLGATPANSASASSDAVAGGDFAQLLDAARAGKFGGNEPATIAEGSGVKLSEDQLRRVGEAVDRAKAQGAAQAVVLIDGMALKVDVLTREIKGSVNLDGGVTGVDAVINVPSANGRGSLLDVLGGSNVLTGKKPRTA
ncbi:MAG: hypothetical protein ACKVW3_02970 [Phycisphaerales bacterium]